VRATLRSNSGTSDLSIELISASEYAHDRGFDVSVQLRGSHWDGEHEHPFLTSVEGIWLRLADLAALREHMVQWLNGPLECLIAEHLDAEFELACMCEQKLGVRFGSRQDTISHFNPVVSITLCAGATRNEFHFVSDQSCLGIFAQELFAMIQTGVADPNA